MSNRKMMFSALMLAALGSQSLLADSLYIGPFLTRTIGDDRDATHVTCRVNLTSVQKEYYVGKENKPQITETVKIDLVKNYPGIWKQLEAAKKAKVSHIVYIQENRPNHKIMAVPGSKDKSPFLLLDNSGGKDTREGKDAATLRAITHTLCGTVTLQQDNKQAVTIPGKGDVSEE